MKRILLGICLAVVLCPVTGWADPDPSPQLLAARKAAVQSRHDLTVRAQRGDLYAIVDLATVTEQGDLASPPDLPGALSLYEKAAARGDLVARQKMCLTYLTGAMSPQDIVKAMPFCNGLGTKDPVGLFAVGYDYEHGLSGPKDDDMAVALYLQAADLGSGEADDVLGVRALALGKTEAARTLFRRGAAFGSAGAMNHLAMMTEAGQGGPADATEAAWLYINAARRGNGHAAERLKALPEPKEPQNISLSAESHLTQISHSFSDAKGPHTESLDLMVLRKMLQDHFPMDTRGNLITGRVLAKCYIGGDHRLDLCLIEGELPLGCQLGRTVQTFFNGQVTVADVDARGNPTANKLLAVSINFSSGENDSPYP